MGNCCMSKRRKPATSTRRPNADEASISINIHNLSSQEHNYDYPLTPSQIERQTKRHPKTSQIKLNRFKIANTPKVMPVKEPRSLTEFGNEPKIEMSFLKLNRDSQQSFQIFGISANGNSSFRKNVKQFLKEGPSKISGRDLMLMSFEDEEVLKFLRKNDKNSVQNLRESFRGMAPHLHLSRRNVVIGESNKSIEFENSTFPNAFKKRYLNILKMNQRDRRKFEIKSRRNSLQRSAKSGMNTQPNEENGPDPNQNLIKEDEWDIDNEIEHQMKKFIQFNQAKYIDVDMWNLNVHEYKKTIASSLNQEHNRMIDEVLLSKRDSSMSLFPKDYEAQMHTIREQSYHNNTTIPGSNNTSVHHIHRRESRFIELTKESMFTVMKGTPLVDNINYASFVFSSNNRSQSSGFLAALVSMVNFDEKFGTKTLQRLIYPHYNSTPCRSVASLHFVKVILNGVRRCFPVSSNHDSLLFFTNKREIYPELLMKPLKIVYNTENIHKIQPNRIIYRFLGWIPQNMKLKEIGNQEECFDKILVNFSKFLVMVSIEYKGKVVPIVDFIKEKRKPKRQIRVFLPMEHQNSDHINAKSDYDSNSYNNNFQVPNLTANNNGRPTQRNRMNKSSNPNKSLVNLDWETIYHENPEATLFISWNPALSHYRRSIHFRVFPVNFHSQSFTTNPLFNYYQKTQLLLSLSPRENESESRIIIERHRQLVNNTLYQIRVELHPYSDFRITTPSGVYKKIEVREDEQYDIVEDTMIFSASSQYDHYILTVEATPLALMQSAEPSTSYYNPKDQLMSAESQQRLALGQLKVYQDLVFTMHFYSSFEASLIEVPFKEVTQWTKLKVTSLQGLSVLLEVKENSDFEIRIEGREHMMYAIKIANNGNSSDSQSDDLSYESEFDDADYTFLWRTPKTNRRAAILSFSLNRGSYVVYFIENQKRRSRRQSEIRNSNRSQQNHISQRRSKRINADRFSPEPSKDYIIEVVSFGESLLQTYESSMEKIRECRKVLVFKNGVEIETRKIRRDIFLFSASWKEEMSIQASVDGQWNKANHFGTRLKQSIEDKFERESTRLSLPNSYCLQQYHRNPAFILKIDTEVNIKIAVQFSDPNLVFKISIFEIRDDLTLRGIFSPANRFNSTVNTSDIVALKNPQNSYLIVLPVESGHRKTNFKLNLLADNSIKSLNPAQDNFCSLPWTEDYEMTITPGLGGSISSPNFLFNHAISLDIGDRTSAVLQKIFAQAIVQKDPFPSDIKSNEDNSENNVIQSTQSPSDIGLYLFKNSNNHRLYQLSHYHLDPYACSEDLQKGISTFFASVPSGKYLLVPTTRQVVPQNKDCLIKINVFSSAEFLFKFEPDPFKVKQKSKEIICLDEKSYFSLNFSNSDASYIVILENPSLEVQKLQINIEEDKGENSLIDRQIVIKPNNFWFYHISELSIKKYSLTLFPNEMSSETLKMKLISNQKNSFNLQRINIIN